MISPSLHYVHCRSRRVTGTGTALKIFEEGWDGRDTVPACPGFRYPLGCLSRLDRIRSPSWLT